MRAIFIGGCDRSGTTFLGSLLGESQRATVTPESQFKTEIYEKLISGELVTPEDVSKYLSSNWYYSLWEVSNLNIGDISSSEEPSDLVRALLLRCVANYSERSGKSCDVWIDHTPRNFMDVHILKTLFPDAIFLHIVRDARAVAASVMNLSWGPNTPIGAAHWWVRNVAPGLAAEAAWPNQVMRISFEELIESPEIVMRQVCEFCELEYSRDMVKKPSFVVPRVNPKQHALIGEGADKSRGEAWKNELSQRQIEIMEAEIGGVLTAMRYLLCFGGKAKRAQKSERIKQKGTELFCTYILNPLRNNFFRLRFLMLSKSGK